MTPASGTRQARTHDGRRPAVRVVLIDGSYLVRSGLRSAVHGQRGLRVVGESAIVADLTSLCETTDAGVALVGLDGSTGSAIDAIARLRASRPDVRVVALCEPDDGEATLAALRAGVDGCVSRQADRRDLLDVLERAAAGSAAIDPALGALLLRRLADAPTERLAAPEPLTPREREILAMMARGETNRQIAGRLVLAVGTVKVHVEHILAKLNVPDRTAAAVRGVELGLVEIDVQDDVARRAGSL